jgi:hypothetical protein
MLSVINKPVILSVVMLKAACRSPECRYAECRGALLSVVCLRVEVHVKTKEISFFSFSSLLFYELCILISAGVKTGVL